MSTPDTAADAQPFDLFAEPDESQFSWNADGENVEDAGDVLDDSIAAPVDLAHPADDGEAATDEPQDADAETAATATEPPADDDAPPWLERFLQAQQDQAQQQQRQLAALVQAMKPSAPAAAEEGAPPPSIDAVLRAGLQAVGLDPEGDEAAAIVNGLALDKGRQFFPEEHHSQIDERVAKANRVVRRAQGRRTVEEKLTALQDELQQLRADRDRAPTLTNYAQRMTTGAEFKRDFPDAAQLPVDVLRAHLDTTINGAVDADKAVAVLKQLDDKLQGLRGKSADEIERIAIGLEWSENPIAPVLRAYASTLATTTNDEPPERQAKQRRPRVPKAPTARGGGRRTDEASARLMGHLFGQGSYDREAEGAELYQRALLTNKPN